MPVAGGYPAGAFLTFAAVTDRLAYALRFLRFFRRAKTAYRVHSPFVFELARELLEDDRYYYAFDAIEALRGKLLEDRRELTITDYGAGSKVVPGNRRTVRSLARYAAKGPAMGRLLFRTVRFAQPRTLLEFGTSLGVSALYQRAAAPPGARLITLEGCPETAAAAARHFAILNRPDIEQVVGPFEQTLVPALAVLDRLDYVFFDGNHREAPTVAYFERCLTRAHDRSVFVFDDIHWSPGMEAAWERVRAHPRVTLTVDLFFVGLVFFRPEIRTKQHYELVPTRWKPWMAGFFSGS